MYIIIVNVNVTLLTATTRVSDCLNIMTDLYTNEAAHAHCSADRPT